MKTTNISQVVSMQSLGSLIAKELALAEQEARVKEEREEVRSQIKASMHAAKLERHLTEDGQQALIYQQERMSWDTDLLHEALTPTEWKRYVPPTADSKALREYLATLETSGEDEKRTKIRGCAVIKTAECLEVRPAAEVEEKPKAKKKSA
jgi:hypothetical protein